MAIAMISVAPAVSQALAARDSAHAMAPDCDQHALAAHGHGSGADAGAGEPADACGYCAMHFVALERDLPPALAAGSGPPSIDVPRLYLHAPRTLYAWAAPPSRAPPAR